MTVRANSDYVIVKVAMPEEKTASGLFLVPDKKERKFEGVVTSVGTAPDIAAYGVKVDDYVFYNTGTNYEFYVENVLYDAVSVYDILATV